MKANTIMVSKYGKDGCIIYSRNREAEQNPLIELSYVVNYLTKEEIIVLRDSLNDLLK